MEYAPVLTFIGLLVFLAHLFVTLFERTKVPDVLYLTLIGVIIGPVLHIVSPLDLGKVGHVFTAIALVVILFEGGLELSFDSLRAALRTTVTMAILSYIVAFVFVSAVAYWLMGLPILLVFYVAAVLAAPAPAVMIPLARQLPMASSTKTMLTLEAPVGEALGIVVALGVLDSIQFESVQIGNLIGRLLASFTFAVVIGGTGDLHDSRFPAGVVRHYRVPRVQRSGVRVDLRHRTRQCRDTGDPVACQKVQHHSIAA
jgi:cell volume regulation protein A